MHKAGVSSSHEEEEHLMFFENKGYKSRQGMFIVWKKHGLKNELEEKSCDLDYLFLFVVLFRVCSFELG